jgi:hypothetical protein
MSCEARDFKTDFAAVQCEVTKRVTTYALLASIAMHFLAIILAMAFVNALNECARESDVYRMFARGQGFLATYKCQRAFRLGSMFSMIAIAAVSLETVGWDAVVVEVGLAVYVVRHFKETSDLLFSNGSLVNYWRSELGGEPDEDDPYDIQPAVHLFKERLKYSHGVLGEPMGRAHKGSLAGTGTGTGAGLGPGKKGFSKRKEVRMDGKSGYASDSDEEARGADADADAGTGTGTRTEGGIDQAQLKLSRESVSKRASKIHKAAADLAKEGYHDQHAGTHGSKAVAIL